MSTEPANDPPEHSCISSCFLGTRETDGTVLWGVGKGQGDVVIKLHRHAIIPIEEYNELLVATGRKPIDL